MGTAANVTVTVANVAADTVAPTVAVTAPTNGATVSGTITEAVNATDNVGVTKVEFLRDGVMYGQDTTAPYSTSFNTTTVTNGSHTFGARAYDAAGNMGTAANVTVTVANDVDADVELLVSTPNVPGGPDGNGRLLARTANTGPNAPESSMSAYTGSCTINAANTVIDSKVVNCDISRRRVRVRASRTRYLNGGIVQSEATRRSPSRTRFDIGVQYPAASRAAGVRSEQRDDRLRCHGQLHDPPHRDHQLQPGRVLRARTCLDPGHLLPRHESLARSHRTSLTRRAVRVEQNATLRAQHALRARLHRPVPERRDRLLGRPDRATRTSRRSRTTRSTATCSSPTHGSGVLRLRRRHRRKAVLGDPTNATIHRVHEQRVPARRERQVRRLRGDHRLQDRSHRERVDQQHVGQRRPSSTREPTGAEHRGPSTARCPDASRRRLRRRAMRSHVARQTQCRRRTWPERGSQRHRSVSVVRTAET